MMALARLVLRVQWALALLGVLVTGIPAAASELGRLLGPATDRDWVEATEALAQSSDPRALEVVEALERGALRQAADGTVAVLRGGTWVAPVSGESVAESSLGEPLALNNRLRRALSQALSRLRLLSPDPEARAAAAAELGKAPDPTARPLVVRALEKETSPTLQSALRFVLARLDLSSTDPDAQSAALKVIEQQGDVALIAEVEPLTRGEGVDARVRVAAQRVLGVLERKSLLINTAANLFYGLSLGSVLLLASLGLAVTFGLMRVINMAHGEMIMLGAYSAFVMQGLFTRYLPALQGAYLLAALPAAFAVSASVGALLERLVIRRLYGRPLETLLATWGISLGLIQTVRLTFGAQNVAVQNPSWLSGGWELTPTVVLPYSRLAAIGFSVCVVVALWLTMQKTRLGLYLRAVTQNREMAGNVGIATRAVDGWTFALGSGIAGLGGVALSQLGNVGPELGQSYIVDSFMVVVLGGVGSVLGTVAAALGLGIVNKMLEPALGAVLGKILLLVVLIVFIRWRPEGLFAPKGRAIEL
jgi:urea transport system permease protein